MNLNLRKKEDCMFDMISLGEIMLRLDPGEGRIKTARNFRAWEGGGEYNVARGLRRCFGMKTAVVTAFLFLLAMFFSPLFLAIPSFAIAPALIIVGFYMMGSVVKINFEDMSEAIPAFLTILFMPLAYSISEGIAVGVISYTLINLICGKFKKLTPLMYVLTVLFICKYIFL